jgi:hypothetical protein
VDITNIGNTTICLKFTPVIFTVNDKEYNGLVKTEERITVGKMECKAHCTIHDHDKDYEVLWELSKAQQLLQPLKINEPLSDHESYSSNSDCSDLEEDDYVHSLPFKVLGSCHSQDRQKALEKANDYIYMYNRPVFAKVQAEPENIHDNNAIAVYIMSEDTYEKVGYIPSELTQYVHPCINSSNFKVIVKSIRFRTTFLMIGFYITITLSKKGLWHKQVIRASKRVK